MCISQKGFSFKKTAQNFLFCAKWLYFRKSCSKLCVLTVKWLCFENLKFENLKIWRWKMRFGQNVVRMTWKERFVQFSWKAHCFSALKRIWGQFHEFEKFGAQKSDLAKTCCASPEKRVLYNFHRKPAVFPFWREFEPSLTTWKTLTLKN